MSLNLSPVCLHFCYCMSKKSCPFLHSESLNKKRAKLLVQKVHLEIYMLKIKRTELYNPTYFFVCFIYILIRIFKQDELYVCEKLWLYVNVIFCISQMLLVKIVKSKISNKFLRNCNLILLIRTHGDSAKFVSFWQYKNI